jgi:acyl-coenzyme A synthetase/AMP-(fatty) acid ligase
LQSFEAAHRQTVIETTQRPSPSWRPPEVMYIMYTSGSTGKPKGYVCGGREVIGNKNKPKERTHKKRPGPTPACIAPEGRKNSSSRQHQYQEQMI